MVFYVNLVNHVYNLKYNPDKGILLGRTQRKLFQDKEEEIEEALIKDNSGGTSEETRKQGERGQEEGVIGAVEPEEGGLNQGEGEY